MDRLQNVLIANSAPIKVLCVNPLGGMKAVASVASGKKKAHGVGPMDTKKTAMLCCCGEGGKAIPNSSEGLVKSLKGINDKVDGLKSSIDSYIKSNKNNQSGTDFWSLLKDGAGVSVLIAAMIKYQALKESAIFVFKWFVDNYFKKAFSKTIDAAWDKTKAVWDKIRRKPPGGDAGSKSNTGEQDSVGTTTTRKTVRTVWNKGGKRGRPVVVEETTETTEKKPKPKPEDKSSESKDSKKTVIDTRNVASILTNVPVVPAKSVVSQKGLQKESPTSQTAKSVVNKSLDLSSKKGDSTSIVAGNSLKAKATGKEKRISKFNAGGADNFVLERPTGESFAKQFPVTTGIGLILGVGALVGVGVGGGAVASELGAAGLLARSLPGMSIRPMMAKGAELASKAGPWIAGLFATKAAMATPVKPTKPAVPLIKASNPPAPPTKASTVVVPPAKTAQNTAPVVQNVQLVMTNEGKKVIIGMVSSAQAKAMAAPANGANQYNTNMNAPRANMGSRVAR